MHNKHGQMNGHLPCMSKTQTECNILVGTPKQVTHTCKILGSHSIVAEDSRFAGREAVSLSVHLPAFLRHYNLQCWEPHTPWHSKGFPSIISCTWKTAEVSMTLACPSNSLHNPISVQ